MLEGVGSCWTVGTLEVVLQVLEMEIYFFSMDNPEVKIDRNGWKYYDRLPDNFRLGTMEDFHIKGKRKIGMEYLIQRADQPHFEIHYMTDETRSIKLKPFFDWDMIFVKIQ